MENEKQNNNQLQIELKEEVAHGIYANFCLIANSSSEFILDFASILPGSKPSVQSRIIMSPEQVKRLLYTLHDNVMKYEHAFGTIRMPEEQAQPQGQQEEGGKTFVPPLSDFKGEA